MATNTANKSYLNTLLHPLLHNDIAVQECDATKFNICNTAGLINNKLHCGNFGQNLIV